ncbi:MAG: Calx-beta domain-containing protein, partial [Planctomycetaceae bacterium]
TVLLDLSTTVNIEDGQGEGSILNDDSSFLLDSPSVAEEDFGTVTLDFAVTLAQPSGVPVTVEFQTSDGNEVQEVVVTGGPTGGDFSLTFGLETTTAIQFDATAAAVQAELEGLTNISGGDVSVTGGPLNVAAVSIEFIGALGGTDVSDLSVATNNLSGGATPDVDVSTLFGSATAGNDYDALNAVTVTFNPNETLVTTSVTVNGDVLLEPDERVFATLQNPTKDGVADGVASLNGGSPGVGTILDDEDPPDIWEISLIPGTPDTIEVLLNSVLFLSTTDLVTMLPLTGDQPGVRDDLFIVDFVGGNPIPTNGLQLDGVSETGADVVQLINAGAGFTTVDYTITGDDASSISLDASSISYVNVEAMVDHTAASDRTITLDSGFAGDHEMLTRNASGTGNSLIEATGASSFGVFSFQNPATSLVINAGPGDNRLTMTPMDPLLTAAVTVNAGDGDDTVDAATYPDSLSINGDADDDLLGGGLGDDTVNGGAGDDSPGGGAGDDQIIGGSGNDTIFEVADANFVLGTGSLTVDDGLAIQTDTLDSIELAELTGGDGDNAIDASGFGGAVTLNGAAGNDTLYGADLDDELNGGSGTNDRVEQTVDGLQTLTNTTLTDRKSV